MSTLYVSDLDGTLLNDQTALDAAPLAALNQLLDNDLLFSVATGRSWTVAKHILHPMHLHLPVLLLNGVHIYDTDHQKTLAVHEIDPSVFKEMISLLQDPFLCSVYYVMKADGNVQLYYQNNNTALTQQYLMSRKKAFALHADYDAILPKSLADVYAQQSICFLIVMGQQEEKLKKLKQQIDLLPHINCHLYKENFTGFISLEIFSDQGGKDKGISFLKKQTHATKVISFGDNLNDLAMKEQSDLFCVVANALDELKAHADCYIGDNNSASVVQFICGRQKL